MTADNAGGGGVEELNNKKSPYLCRTKYVSVVFFYFAPLFPFFSAPKQCMCIPAILCTEVLTCLL